MNQPDPTPTPAQHPQGMPLDQAQQLLANVAGQYRGTREEHMAIDAALRVVFGTLQELQGQVSALTAPVQGA